MLRNSQVIKTYIPLSLTSYNSTLSELLHFAKDIFKTLILSTELKVNCPEPISPNDQIELFKSSTDIKSTIEKLEAGQQILISNVFSNGLILLRALKMHLKKKFPDKSFLEQRNFRSEYRKLSNLILIEVVKNELVVKKAPFIGWLEKLYPELDKFLLPFPQVQGLNSSWQWYNNGISIPVLRNKIHPFYGVYFPTRFEHLEIFDNWLKRYKGPKKNAIDVGCGSGILSFQLVKYKFQKVYATDTNPNAIIGLKEFMGDTKLSRKIELDFGNLFGKFEKQTELIVFNPPWLPAAENVQGIDEAIYYNDKLFPDFFEEAKKRLLPEGKLVLLFSNLAQITNVTKEHPIEKELREGGRFELEKCFKKTVKAASDKTKRDANWRAAEEVELWALVHK